MREQPATRSHDKRLVAFADLIRIDESRQKLEIDLGYGRTGVPAGVRHRDGHERIKSVEIDRRQPDGSTLRLGESRIAGVVDLTALDELLARQSQLLPAGPVEMNHPVDGRHLLKQQCIVCATLLGGG